nr:EOG090X07NA [Simocephalus serrulatus]
MLEEDNDPVIREIPVFLSKNLFEKLYVFQYPLRSVAVEIDTPNISASRIKPKLQDIELELDLPTKTPNYDRSKGEQLCINADGPDKYDKPDHQNFFKGSIMDKITYTSTKALLDPGRFAVGILVDNELHINPIHGILHVKPSFPYLDKSDKTLKETGVEAESGDEEEVAEQITVKFARTETERSKTLREKSYGFLQKKNAEEPWIHTKFYPCHSEESKLEKNRLICGKPDSTVQNITLPKEKYISNLIGPSLENEEVQKQLTLGSVSMFQIRKMPQLVDKVKHLMANVKLISFNQLCNILEIVHETQKLELLKSLQQVAELVQGNWVVKSEILFPSAEKDKPGKLCGITGIHPDIMSKARDYFASVNFQLHMYTTSRFVNRKAVTVATKIPSEEMKVILEQIALKTKDGWEFRLPYDQAFVDKYPEVVRRHELMNKAKQKQLQIHVGICIPNVEFVLGLVGATLGTAVCSVAPAWIYLQVAPTTSGERWIAKVVFICGLGILILGTAANIYAEEEYSESHSAILDLPPNLKEIEAKFNHFEPRQQAQLPLLMDSHDKIGEGGKEELVYNRKPILPSFEKTINNESEAIVPPVDIQIVDDSPLIKPTQKVVDVLPAEKPVVKKKR